MSYILDALQKSSSDIPTDALPSSQQAPSAGLSPAWKMAIGGVLATNLVLLFLWQTERGPAQRSTGQTATQSAIQPASAAPPGSALAPYQSTPRATVEKKKTLPGIASPRELKEPKPAASARNSTATRTFRPTGAPITIADMAIEETASGTATAAPRTSSPAARAAPKAPPGKDTGIGTQAAPNQTASVAQKRGVLQLSDLENAARESLYVLTFSFHIYADDADLRAVVVNGQRQSEGGKIIADNGQEFRLIEILETGVILQFDYKGTTQTVQIPVIEDWKNA